MSYRTLMVHSVVVIPKSREYKFSESVNVTKKKKEIDGKKDFASVLRQAMR